MDEVGEMSLQMQAILLRFLENGEIQRVGSERRSAVVDVRVIAATNRRLIDRVATNEFREDLFYRLNVIHIEIPPLRERPDDIPALVNHFLGIFSETYRVARPQFSAEALEQLMAAPWPGNVRQLRNVLERLIVNAHRGIVTAADLPREVLTMIPSAAAVRAPSAAMSNEELFKRMVQRGESFWTAVYAPFMARDLTRDDVRAIISEGLRRTRGGYKAVAALFNIGDDHRRLVSFLRKHNCHMPEQDLHRAAAVLEDSRTTRAVG
jgi:DNA-binding NtrC family response regulator